ncbi:MAG: hypothetical protein JWQ38_2612 [Flavipsychrobacter sp.]|nr:hypothetical protein [Flavipsychrobacter sp.]
MKVFLYLFLLLQLFTWPGRSEAQTISTIAGNGYYSYSGDGGPASAAQFFIPNGLALDGSGNMYVADKFNHCIRKITPAGIVSTIAGNGEGDYTGDGVPATATSLYTPPSVTVDGAGNVYIPDFGNNRVRKVTPAGIISTVAGNGFAGYFGDNGPATDAKLYGPASVVFDPAGNMYVSCQLTHVIRKINTSGVITRFAGTSAPGYSGNGGPATAAMFAFPSGLAIDAAGNIYICDYTNCCVRKVNPAGIISTIAGKATAGYSGDGGQATNAELDRPNALNIDAAGNIYVADVGNNCVRKINTSGIISTIAGNGTAGFSGDGGPATAATIMGCETVVRDPSGNIYIGDSGSFRIRKVNTSGIISTYGGGTGDGHQATANSMNVFHSIVDASGNIYVSDGDNNRICKINSSGIVTTIAGNQSPGYSGDGGPATAAQLDYPVGVAIDASNNIYVIDQDNSVIRKISAAGIITTIAGDGTLAYGGDNGPATNASMHFPMSMAIDNAGNVFFADKTNNRVRKISTSGIMTTIAGTGAYNYTGDGGPATDATLENPIGVAFDIAGNLYVSNAGNGTIRKIDNAGIISTVAGTGIIGNTGDGGPATAARLSLNGISVDSSGNIFTVDGHRLCRKINALGIITTIAGTGTSGFSGDGGPATAAQLHNTTSVTTDGAGNVYISDYDNYRLRKITTNQLPKITGTLKVCLGGTSTLSDATPGGTWTSLGTTVATVGSSSGVVTGVNVGTATIVYDVAGNTTATTVTVVPLPTVAAITGSVSSVCAGGGTITVTDATPGGTWSSSNANASVSGGTVTGISGGTSTISYVITAACGTATATKTITINPLPPASTITGPSAVCMAGGIITLTDAIAGGTWSSSNTNASVSGGTVTGIVAGTSTISYVLTNSCGSTPAVKTITINPLPDAGTITGPSAVCELSSVTLSDAIGGGIWSSSSTTISVSGNVVTGVSAGTGVVSYAVTTSCGTAYTTKTITVNPLPSGGVITGPSFVCIGSAVNLTDAVAGGVWSNSSTTIAVAGPVVFGLNVGTGVISYTVTNGCGTALATYTIVVNPMPSAGSITGPSNLCEGTTITLTDAVTGGVWSSSNTNASVLGGVVNGIIAGTSNISYTVTTVCGTVSAIVTITIDQLPFAGTITGASSVCEGAFIVLTDAATGGIWSSSNTNVVVTDSMVTGAVAGTSMVMYSVTNGCGTDVASKVITVNPLPVVITGTAHVCVGGITSLNDNTPGGSWSSDNSFQVAVGSASGIVSGLAVGTANISYTLGTGCSVSVVVTIDPIPAAIGGAASVCVNAIAQLNDLNAGGTWRSANISLAGIDSMSGVVRGVAEGVVSITYTLPTGCSTNGLVRIDPLPYVLPITGATVVCVDSGISLSDGVNGGIWSVKNPLATVSATGQVKGLAPGNDTVMYAVTNVCGTATESWALSISSCNSAGIPTILHVYPNPNDGDFTLMLSSGSGQEAAMYITNVLGQKVLIQPIITNQAYSISLLVNQASGIYLVTALLGNNKYETKVVVIH